MEDFYLLPVGDKLMQYDRLALNTAVTTRTLRWYDQIGLEAQPCGVSIPATSEDCAKFAAATMPVHPCFLRRFSDSFSGGTGYAQ